MPPWDRREVPGLFDAEAAARRLGHYTWFEMRLFEVVGGWVASTPELDVKVRFGTNCNHHAWHAQLFHQRLPAGSGRVAKHDGASEASGTEAELARPSRPADLHPDGLTAPANPEMESFVASLEEPTGTLERLVGLYRVAVPWAASAYTFHLNRSSSVADAPTMRVLRLVLDDLAADQRDGEMLVQSMLNGPDDVDRAAEHQRHLERLVVAAGGIAGPGSAG